MGQKIQQTKSEHLIGEQLSEKFAIAYICVDHAMRVISVSDNLPVYGYTDIPVGSDISDHVDFMVGMDAQTDLELDYISSPTGASISVSLMPNTSTQQLLVVINDVSKQAEQRELIQQKANENELLLRKQEELVAKLEQASQSLEYKNQQLEEASRLQTMFLSGVSHEFRTPLASIIGRTDLLQSIVKNDGVSDSVDFETQLHAVQRSSQHLLSLVENLLDHGKFDSNEIILQPKATELVELFYDVQVLLSPLSAAKNIGLNFNTEFADDIAVYIDDSRLRQCLVNLVGNAIKFTDEGSVDVSACIADDVLTVNIVDTGIGIKEQDIEQVKQPFWQAENTGKSGTGLGLTITEKIIELMGGELSLTSQYGVGTKVKFDLSAPQVTQQDLAQQDVVQNERQIPTDFRILLVEDDFDIAGLVMLTLAEHQIAVSHAENGDVALNVMAEEQFDLVLMDLNMPIMGGHETVQALRERGDTSPIVIMSASASEADRILAEELACDGYLVKPVDIADILTMAKQIASNKNEVPS